MIDSDIFVGMVHGDPKGELAASTGKLGYHPLLAIRADVIEVLRVGLRQR